MEENKVEMPTEMGQHENSVHEIQCKCSDGSIRPGFPSHLRVPGERGHVPTVAEPRVWITEPERKGHGGFGGEQLHFPNVNERDTRARRQTARLKFFPVSHKFV